MKIRHHFPRPVGRRHPAWWVVIAIVLGSLALLLLAATLYLSPLTLVYGAATLTGNRVSIGKGEPRRKPGEEFLPSTKINFPLGPGQQIAGEYQSYHWRSTSEIELTGVTVGDFFYADAVRLSWSWKRVFRSHRLKSIELDKPVLYLGKLLAAFPRTGEGDAEPADSGGDPFAVMRRIFYRFRVNKGVIWLDDISPGMPTLPLTLGWKDPIDWTTGSLTHAEGEEKVKFAEMNGIVLYAPNAPEVRVLDLGKIRVGFKWEGLARHEIESLAVNSPTIYVGPGLFDFASAFKQGGTAAGGAPAITATGVDAPPSAPTPQATAAAPSAKQEWTLKDFSISGGRIEITAFGDPGLLLPFTFRSAAQNMNLSHLDQLSLQNKIEIPKRDYDYPSYGLQLKAFSGNIYFSLPPGSAKANNLVNEIKIDEARWKDLALTQVWSSVTFDKTGIYGQIGGAAYKGYVNGAYAIRFDDGFPWHAGLYITNAGVREPVEKLAGKSFTLDGLMTGRLEVDAKAKQILKTEAKVSFPQGGRMTIASVDDLARKLPAEWAPWKKQIVDNILGGFKDYRFDTGALSAAYGVPTSHAQLTLEGTQGRRNFELNWTQEGSAAPFVLPDKRPPQLSIQAHP